MSIKPFLESSSFIVNDIAMQDPMIDITTLLEQEQEVTIFPYDDNTMIIKLTDDTQLIGGEPYAYSFAVQYN